MLAVISLLAVCHAQPSKDSPIFDPDCYFPDIDNKAEVDTIYGSHGAQYFGEWIWNDGRGRVYIGEDTNVLNAFMYTAVSTGPSFNLHKLQKLSTGILNDPLSRLGHYRSQAQIDVMSSNYSIIHWADENGFFDKSRTSSIAALGFGESKSNIYSANLSSDSVNDFIQIVIRKHDFSNPADRMFDVYAIHWKGGDSLYIHGNNHNYSSVCHLGIMHYDSMPRWQFAQGDFRGVGREDAILAVTPIQGKEKPTLFFFKNEPPFTLEKFANSVVNDTLLSWWDNRSIDSDYYNSIDLLNSLTMRAFSKPAWDRSVDLIVRINTDTSLSAHLFKGGPGFGAKRLSLPGDFAIPSPVYVDPTGFNFTSWDAKMQDCGDMTGSGNRVLMLCRNGSGSLFDTQLFFYVTGRALDAKADMYYEGNEFNLSSFSLDTLTANADTLTDILIGMPEFAFPEDHTDAVGTVHLLYGSKKIPVKINPNYTVTEVLPSRPLLATPNPCYDKTVLTFDNCSDGRMYMEVVNSLGRVMLREEIVDVDGLQQYSADLSVLVPGAYHIRLVCPADGWSATANVVKTGW